MTDTQIYTLLVRLKCCAANYADSISTKLQYGACDETIKLFLLNGFIELIQKWDNDDDASNCMTEDQFDDAVTKAKNICRLCDCD
jgi:hypothetical protein